ncbi:MAG TPA: hypothetical protein VIP11_22665 [Gemmatimonadaceae bacterium]
MPTLMALAGWEDAIRASLSGATGTIEEKDAQVRRSGLYAEYPAVLRCYIDLFAVGSERPEALKRAVFLVWLSTAEPAPFTGVAELPEGYAREVMSALEADARGGRLDDEFRAMLAWYHSILPLSFEIYGANRHAPEIAREVAPDAWRREFTAAQFAHRGQLGEYWRSVLGSAAAGR